MPSAVPEDTFYVPTIDIASYLESPESAAAQQVIKDVRAACISTGFFQIVGHGVPKTTRQGVFDAAAEFFKLPLEEKMKLDAAKAVGHRGYDVLASQSYEEGVMPDLKEGFYVGSEVSSTNPLHGRFYMGPNNWPSSNLIAESNFHDPCRNYHAALEELSLKVLGLVGATLGADSPHISNQNENGPINGGHRIPSVFDDLGSSSPTPITPLRLLHYPSATRSGGGVDKPQYGASAHTDFGAITLLLQDENPGLEVLDTTPEALATGKNIWRPIDPNPDAYVVNIGDMISMITGGLYKSSIHRVVCKKPENERYSIVFFFDGCIDAELRPVEGLHMQDGKDNKVLTVEQHMFERLRMSYGTGKKDTRRDG